MSALENSERIINSIPVIILLSVACIPESFPRRGGGGTTAVENLVAVTTVNVSLHEWLLSSCVAGEAKDFGLSCGLEGGLKYALEQTSGLFSDGCYDPEINRDQQDGQQRFMSEV